MEEFFEWGVDGGPYATKSQCESVLTKKAAPTDNDEFRCEFFQNARDLDHELNWDTSGPNAGSNSPS